MEGEIKRRSDGGGDQAGECVGIEISMVAHF
jgi:hypothetical protein